MGNNMGFYAETGDMKDVSNNTVNLSEDFATQIKKINDGITGLMTEWQGEAATKFQDETSEKIKELNDFQNYITVFANNINSAAEIYDSNEESIKNNISNL